MLNSHLWLVAIILGNADEETFPSLETTLLYEADRKYRNEKQVKRLLLKMGNFAPSRTGGPPLLLHSDQQIIVEKLTYSQKVH